jgi:hypothetical protein
MSEGPKALLWFGFGITCVGFGALYYTNRSLRKQRSNRESRRMTRAEYWSRIKEQWEWPWPFYTAAVCIPLGVAVAFGAIIYSNHMKLR